MSSKQEDAAAMIETARGMLGQHLSDFSDADMLARSSPSANHVAYQLGHLLRTTGEMFKAFAPNAAPFAMPPKTEGDAKAPPTSDDASAFATKAELLGGFERMLETLAGIVRKASDADLEKPSPEQFARFAPTLGRLTQMVPFHVSMHIGQIQAIRRKLGKPVLF